MLPEDLFGDQDLDPLGTGVGVKQPLNRPTSARLLASHGFMSGILKWREQSHLIGESRNHSAEQLSDRELSRVTRDSPKVPTHGGVEGQHRLLEVLGAMEGLRSRDPARGPKHFRALRQTQNLLGDEGAGVGRLQRLKSDE
jgi:hypothetical protein